MTKKQVYGGGLFGFGKKPKATATEPSQPAPVTAPPVPAPASATEIARFHNALLGGDFKNFQVVCKSIKDIEVLNNSFGDIFNHKDVKGLTPLTYLITKGKDDFFEELLIMPGIDVNKQDSKGETPLTQAVSFKRVSFVESLLSADKIEVNLENKFGQTPIFLASETGNADILTLLIDNGGDFNLARNNGTTPLGIAIHEKKKAVVKKQEAVVKKQEAVIEILENKGATDDTYNDSTPESIYTGPIGGIHYNQDKHGGKKNQNLNQNPLLKNQNQNQNVTKQKLNKILYIKTFFYII